MTNNQLTDERLAELVAFRPLPGTDINSATRDEWMAMAAELHERRKAERDSDPVATLDVQSRRPDGNKFALVFSSAAHKLPDDVYFLYRHAQQPVVQCPFPCGWDNLNKLAIQDAALVARGLVEGEPTSEAQRQAAISNNDRLLKVISACRAAMLNAGNSPVIPDGYVMVPKEPTKEMIDAGWLHFMGTKNPSSKGTYKAMLAAAPQDTPALNSLQSVDSVAGKWIPVSERMPENDVSVLTFDGMYKRVHHAMYGHWQCWEPEKITHWMPLPAAQQEVK